MKKYFVTFGHGPYQATRDRLCHEVRATGEFDIVIGYGPEHLTLELVKSSTYSSGIKGGYYSWKPDVIVSTVDKMDEGDILFYVDAGSSVVSGREWAWYFRQLKRYELVAQRIYLPTGEWTRRELIDAFPENGKIWRKCRQFTSNVVILRKTAWSSKFVHDWRRAMINHPEWAMDVPKDKIKDQYPEFQENRYDQAIYSALVYQTLQNIENRGRILAKWEHVEDIDPLFSQVIRITRLRNSQELTNLQKQKLMFRRVLKDYIRKPFYAIPECIRLEEFGLGDC